MISFVLNILLVSGAGVPRELLAHSASCCVGACLCAPLCVYGSFVILKSTTAACCLCDPILYAEEEASDSCGRAWEIYEAQIKRTHDLIAPPPQQQMTPQTINIQPLPMMLGNQMQLSISV